MLSIKCPPTVYKPLRKMQLHFLTWINHPLLFPPPTADRAGLNNWDKCSIPSMRKVVGAWKQTAWLKQTKAKQTKKKVKNSAALPGRRLQRRRGSVLPPWPRVQCLRGCWSRFRFAAHPGGYSPLYWLYSLPLLHNCGWRFEGANHSSWLQNLSIIACYGHKKHIWTRLHPYSSIRTFRMAALIYFL